MCHVDLCVSGLPQVKDLHASVLRGDVMVTWAPPDQPVSTYVVDWNTKVGPHNWIDTSNTNILLTGTVGCVLGGRKGGYG